MTPDEIRLLRSYAAGPRIWDAASLVPVVFSLRDQGYIEPTPGTLTGGSYRLTARGRQVLTEQES